MRFEEAYGGWCEGRLLQEEAARLLGVCERSFHDVRRHRHHPEYRKSKRQRVRDRKRGNRHKQRPEASCEHDDGQQKRDMVVADGYMLDAGNRVMPQFPGEAGLDAGECERRVGGAEQAEPPLAAVGRHHVPGRWVDLEK